MARHASRTMYKNSEFDIDVMGLNLVDRSCMQTWRFSLHAVVLSLADAQIMSHFYEKTISKEVDENRRVGAGMLQRERSSVVMAFAAGVMVTMALSAAWPAATIESALAQQSYSRMERLPRPATTVASALSQDRRPQQNEHMRMYLTPCLANVEDVSMKVAITSNKVGNPMKRSDKCDGHSCEDACI